MGSEFMINRRRNESVRLCPLTQEHAYTIWKIGYQETYPEWAKFNAPYFEEYESYTYEQFLEKETSYQNTERVRGIFVDGNLVGCVTRYWMDKRTRWLEIGIIIFDVNYWSKGIGTKALRLWITDTFQTYPELEHVGLTTWSGNLGMMKCSEHLGLTKEACIRKVRYWQGVYYDSVKYGVLRSEWESKEHS